MTQLPCQNFAKYFAQTPLLNLTDFCIRNFHDILCVKTGLILMSINSLNTKVAII